jgi:hypothetical protein
MRNFHNPYFACSTTDFWRRWHISLSTWFKDYLYIPLGGSRRGKARQMVNLLTIFLISGLWHGAAWHFVFWGLLHGLYQLIGRLTTELRGTLRQKAGLRNDASLTRFMQTAITFTLVCFAWIFFRASNLASAFLICGRLAALPVEIAGYISQLPQTGIVMALRGAFSLGDADLGFLHPIDGFYLKSCAVCFVSIIVLTVTDFLSLRISWQAWIKRLPLVIRWAGYYMLTFIFLLRIRQTEFIYFTF